MSALECPVCLEPFDEGEREPKIIPCNGSHELCARCVETVRPDASSSFSYLRVHASTLTVDSSLHWPHSHRRTSKGLAAAAAAAAAAVAAVAVDVVQSSQLHLTCQVPRRRQR
jgi:hypothetical protein